MPHRRYPVPVLQNNSFDPGSRVKIELLMNWKSWFLESLSSEKTRAETEVFLSHIPSMHASKLLCHFHKGGLSALQKHSLRLQLSYIRQLLAFQRGDHERNELWFIQYVEIQTHSDFSNVVLTLPSHSEGKSVHLGTVWSWGKFGESKFLPKWKSVLFFLHYLGFALDSPRCQHCPS